MRDQDTNHFKSQAKLTTKNHYKPKNFIISSIVLKHYYLHHLQIWKVNDSWSLWLLDLLIIYNTFKCSTLLALDKLQMSLVFLISQWIVWWGKDSDIEGTAWRRISNRQWWLPSQLWWGKNSRYCHNCLMVDLGATRVWYRRWWLPTTQKNERNQS